MKMQSRRKLSCKCTESAGCGAGCSGHNDVERLLKVQGCLYSSVKH